MNKESEDWQKLLQKIELSYEGICKKEKNYLQQISNHFFEITHDLDLKEELESGIKNTLVEVQASQQKDFME